MSARYFVRSAAGIVSGKPWAVSDDIAGACAQTAGARGPLAYFATQAEADGWAAEMNARHADGTAPDFEIEIPYWVDEAAFRAKHTPPGGVGVKFLGGE